MSIFANMKIGRRLGLGFAVVLALAVLITAISVWQLNAVANDAREMMQLPLAKERLISDWGKNITTAVVRTTAVAKSNDPALAKFFEHDAAESAKSSSALIKKIEPILTSEQEKNLFKKLMEIRKAYTINRDQVFKLQANGQTEEANKALDTGFIPISSEYQKVVTDFLSLQRASLDAKAAEIDIIEKSGRNHLMLLAALVVGFGVFCAWWLTTGITRPLNRAVAVARRVADGDLTGDIEVTSKDESGQLMQALKVMNGNLLQIVGRVRVGTDAMATASSEIAAGNLDLSSRTEQQAASIEETASSMEELTSTVKQNAENAAQANQLANSASGIAVKGGQVVSEVVQTMEDITSSSRKIVDIIGVIDGIAFQTNILALNAAVEAARAGEQGRGFAVVAAEVRTLAQRSANAAKEIKALIDDSVNKVSAGSALVERAGSTMEEIVGSVKRVTDIMAEITAASREQSAGIEEVNRAIAQMDQVTQQNAALVEEAAAAAAAMQEQSARLAETVGGFKLDARAAAPAARAETALLR
jgi:methyl-accepting chemotaxis protein